MPRVNLGKESVEEADLNHRLARYALQMLSDRSVLPAGPAPQLGGHAETQRAIEEGFVLPQTSITTRMSRLLLGISEGVAPRAVLCAGSAYGNALAWLAAPTPPSTLLVGFDPDARATARAQENFRTLGRTPELHARPAQDAPGLYAAPFDLVLLDADDPVCGKDVCVELLVALRPLYRPGTIILAHDANYPKFQAAFDRYRALVRDTTQFQASVGVAIDQFGLEVTRV